MSESKREDDDSGIFSNNKNPVWNDSSQRSNSGHCNDDRLSIHNEFNLSSLKPRPGRMSIEGGDLIFGNDCE